METEIIILIVSIIALLLISAFFSGSETALMSSSKPKLHKMEKEGNSSAARVNRVIACPERLLSTILLGNNLVNIAASALTTGLFIKLFGDTGILWATLIMTFLVLIFAEILPKTVASRAPEKHSMWISVPMSVIIVVLKPFTTFISKISGTLIKALGIKHTEDSNFGEDDVRGAIGMGLEEGVLEKGEHRMLDSVLELDEIDVDDVMVHRQEIESLNCTMTMEELHNHIASQPVHSRIPIWKDEADNIIGILHVKDFYMAYHAATMKKQPFDLEKVMQAPYFVPETVKVSEQLMEFRKNRRHMAIVVDEYGDIKGLLTLEDILEEIVGEIEDEHDIPEPDFYYERDGSITLTGDYPVRDANREFDWELPTDDEAVSIAGLIIEIAGRMPNVDEVITIAGLNFKIIQKKKQAILKVNTQTPAKEEPAEAEEQ